MQGLEFHYIVMSEKSLESHRKSIARLVIEMNSIMAHTLQKFCESDVKYMEIGIDEAGRGPMFGPVYAGAVLLPRDDSFDHSRMKDSKKFHSEKKIREAAEYIKDNATAWAVGSCTAEEIDKLNIRNATHTAMHRAVKQVMDKMGAGNYHLLVDGRDFKQMMTFSDGMLMPVRYTCFEGGDNKYTSIAAASILAKVERDTHIAALCAEDAELDELYGIGKNKGYGTKVHLDGIGLYGITRHHRKTFGACKGQVVRGEET